MRLQGIIERQRASVEAQLERQRASVEAQRRIGELRTQLSEVERQIIVNKAYFSNAKYQAKRQKTRDRIKLAERRAASLLRPLTSEEQEKVQDAMSGGGDPDEVLAQCGTDTVHRRSMSTLKPGIWCNDEVLHYFMLMLAKRDEGLCQQQDERKRCHFFKSFFMTKMLNEGHGTMDGQYQYSNVRQWSKKVPGQDIFELNKMFFPVNFGEKHWFCVMVDVPAKKIQVFDSISSIDGLDEQDYLQSLFRYLQDEHMDKKKSPLPDLDDWKLIPCQRKETPLQNNGTCMCCNLAVSAHP